MATKPPLSPTAEPDSYNDARSSALNRSNTSAYIRPRAKSGDLLLPSRANSTTASARPVQPRFGYRAGGWNELGDSTANGVHEEETDDEEEDQQEWGLHKGMELFEVSAKDDFGKYR